MSGGWPGHSVLAVPVPALDDWVRERTRGHDPAWVSTDPGFVHAHAGLRRVVEMPGESPWPIIGWWRA